MAAEHPGIHLATNVGDSSATVRADRRLVVVVAPRTPRADDARQATLADRLEPIAKRAFDIAFASVALLLLAPVFGIIALAIRVGSPGPVFFVQDRVGLSGQTFRCFKFRTMVPDAHWLLERDETLRDAFFQSWKLVRDPRVTSVGRILRKTSLDELPQLLNVLKGDMSIVGPRPVQPEELIARYGHRSPLVTSVRPGMTGLWQVSGRSSTTYDRRVALDVTYVRKRSLLFDVLIILKTIPALLFARGAH